MSTTLTLPKAAEIGTFLTSLYGLEIDAGDAELFDASAVRACAEYVDDDGEVGGIIACNLQSAAILGAALTRIPPGAVEDSIESGSLPENLAENLSEVFNIAVNLVPQSYARRLVFGNATFGNEAKDTFDSRSYKADISTYRLKLQQYGDVVLTIGSKG